jgi:hypothetical protein
VVLGKFRAFQENDVEDVLARARCSSCKGSAMADQHRSGGCDMHHDRERFGVLWFGRNASSRIIE